MELSELSTSAQSSGYNSSTASSSLNFIDDQEQSQLKVDDNNNHRESQSKSEDEPVASRLIITITLVKFEDRVDEVDCIYKSEQYYICCWGVVLQLAN